MSVVEITGQCSLWHVLSVKNPTASSEQKKKAWRWFIPLLLAFQYGVGIWDIQAFTENRFTTVRESKVRVIYKSIHGVESKHLHRERTRGWWNGSQWTWKKKSKEFVVKCQRYRKMKGTLENPLFPIKSLWEVKIHHMAHSACRFTSRETDFQRILKLSAFEIICFPFPKN